ncbi:MAG: outer membrane beta-barrel protein [Pseudomonadota bacterium]
MKNLSKAALLMLCAAPVSAGGLDVPVEPPIVKLPPAPPPVVLDWTGFYAGAQLDSAIGGDLTDVGDIDATLYGVFGGYRKDLGSFVLGAEVDYMLGSGEINAAQAPIDFDVDSLLRVGVEAGFDAGNTLIYGTVGYADLNLSVGGADQDGDGVFYGLGVDYRVSDRVIIGGELLQHDFNDFNGAAGNDLDILTIGVNVGIQF